MHGSYYILPEPENSIKTQPEHDKRSFVYRKPDRKQHTSIRSRKKNRKFFFFFLTYSYGKKGHNFISNTNFIFMLGNKYISHSQLNAYLFIWNNILYFILKNWVSTNPTPIRYRPTRKWNLIIQSDAHSNLKYAESLGINCVRVFFKLLLPLLIFQKSHKFKKNYIKKNPNKKKIPKLTFWSPRIEKISKFVSCIFSQLYLHIWFFRLNSIIQWNYT